MSYPPPPGQDPNNPYAQQPPQQPGGQPGYGYPQQPGAQPGYGYPQQQPGGIPGQPGYGYPQQAGTVQANNGYIKHYVGPMQLATMGQRFLAA